MQRLAVVAFALCVAFVICVAAACGNAGLPAFESSRPRPLASVGPPRATTDVRIAMKSLPWWTVAGTSEAFVLGFDDNAAPPPRGRRIGALRSRDIDLAPDIYDAVRCAWQVVPMGESRPCSRTSRTDAMAIARDAITEARAELRAHAGDAGAGAVIDVRCFAERDRMPVDDDRGGARLWCEGVALDTGEHIAVGASPDGGQVPHREQATHHEQATHREQDPTPAADGQPVALDADPAAPIDHEPRLPGTRLVLLADASIGFLGKRPIVGSTLALRYRPFELGFYILDLQRDRVSPRDDGLVGIGMTGLGRIALGRTRADAIVGVSSVVAAVNNTTNPDFESLYHGFAGVAYQTPWRIAGAAQPFVQLRAGAATGGVVTSIAAARAVPMFELHVGLTSPERR
jgi:hypothetical protein